MSKKEASFYGLILFSALTVFYFSYGWNTLDPTNINWLLSAHQDWGTHYLGWMSYRNEPWSYPLGTIENYNYPVGTNIGLTDSIPVLALLFKPFSAILPNDFQYFGMWMLLCFFLIGIYTYKILRLYKTNAILMFFAVVLVMINPVLIFRGLHPALCSQWLIIASFYYYLKPVERNSDIVNTKQLLLLILSAMISPYMTAMIGGFNVILVIKHYRSGQLSRMKAILYPLAGFAGATLFWIISGMLELHSGTNLTSFDNFNNFSFNLNGFFDSYGVASKFLPDLGRTNVMQHEGFSYLGMGMIFLLVAVMIYTVWRYIKSPETIKQYSKKYVLLLLLCFVLLLFAVTNEVTFGTSTLLHFPIPKFIEKIFRTFRAAGRFVWPFYYLVYFLCFVVLIKSKFKSIYKIAFLGFIIFLQIFDTAALITARADMASGNYDTPLSDEKWKEIFRRFDSVVVYPPFTFNYSMTYNLDYQDICFLALKSGKPVSNAYVARANGSKGTVFSEKIKTQLASGSIDDNQIFVTTEAHLVDFKQVLQNNKACAKKLDNFIFVFAKNKESKLLRYFESEIVKLKDSK